MGDFKHHVDKGAGHILYSEAFQRDKVYLQLKGASVEFIADQESIRVAIPADVWERIRTHGIEEFSGHWWEDEPVGDEDDPDGRAEALRLAISNDRLKAGIARRLAGQGPQIEGDFGDDEEMPYPA